MLTFIILTIFFLVTSRDVNLYNFKAVNFEGILIIRLIEIWWQIQILDWWGLGWQKDPDTSHDYFSFKTRNKMNCHILNNNWTFFIIIRFLRKSNLTNKLHKHYEPFANVTHAPNPFDCCVISCKALYCRKKWTTVPEIEIFPRFSDRKMSKIVWIFIHYADCIV